MSTTVILSRQGLGLYLLPSAAPPLDLEAVRPVLARHGLELVADSSLSDTNELIVAQGLDPHAAAALSEDLRKLGHRVRVVDDPTIRRSARVGQALSALSVAAMFAAAPVFGGAIGTLKALKRGTELGGTMVWASVITGLVLVGWLGFNALVLQRRGGIRLRLATTKRQAPSALGALQQELRALADHLPEHLAAPLLTQSQRLEGLAQLDPEGPVARELRTLLDELSASTEAEAVEEARALRDEVHRARRALHETTRT